MNAPALIAEFTNGSKARSPRLTISALADGHRKFIRAFEVIDKRHARKVAAVNHAKPWNF